MRQSLFGRQNPNRKKIELTDSFALDQLIKLANDNKWEQFTERCKEIQQRYTQSSIERQILTPSITLRFQGKKYESRLIHKVIAANPTERALMAFCSLSNNKEALGIDAIATLTSSFQVYVTPLEIACLNENFEMVKLLLEKDADPNIVRSDNSSILSLMCYRTPEKTLNEALGSAAKILQEYGAVFSPNDFNDFSSVGSDGTYVDLQGLTVKTDISSWNLYGSNLIGADLSQSIGSVNCLINDSVYSPDTKFPDGFHLQSYGMKRAHYDREKKCWVDFRSHNSTNQSLRYKHQDSAIQLLPKTFAGQKLNWGERTTELLIDIACEAQRELYDIFSTDLSSIISLMPYIQSHHCAQDLRLILSTFEQKLDQYFYVKGRAISVHPMEPELMASLGMIDFADEVGTSALTRVLTAQTQWISLGDEVPRHKITDSVAFTWAELGRLSLSFKKWKYDAFSPMVVDGDLRFRTPSVLEQFGFETIRRTSDKEYKINYSDEYPGLGVGAILSDERIKLLSQTEVNPSFTGVTQFSPTTYIELRHGYILISVPGLGTLIIRNSSTDFGRDRLKFTAAYSPKDIRNQNFRKNILDFDHQTYNKHFLSIFNRQFSRLTNPAPHNIRLLLGHLLHFENCFDDWKFDSNPETAFRKSVLGHFDLIGGYRSEGFRYVLDIAKAIFENNPNDCNLAFTFYRKGKVPYFGEEFPYSKPYIPTNNVSRQVKVDSLPVSAERLELLYALANEDALLPDFNNRLQSSGVRDFLQKAGFDRHGCIALTNIWSNEKW